MFYFFIMYIVLREDSLGGYYLKNERMWFEYAVWFSYSTRTWYALSGKNWLNFLAI